MDIGYIMLVAGALVFWWGWKIETKNFAKGKPGIKVGKIGANITHIAIFMMIYGYVIVTMEV